MKVTYGKSMLRVTKQYENERITVEVEDEVRTSETADDALLRLRRFVDGKILDELVEKQVGIEEAVLDGKMARRRKVRETAARQFNLLDGNSF